MVVLPHLSASVFPSGRGHGRWPTSPEVLPLSVRDEPVTPALAGFPGPDGPRARDHSAFAAECRRLELLEETRLGYVAVTRAERLLVATGAWWGPEQTRRRGPSPFLSVLAEHCRDGAGEVVGLGGGASRRRRQPAAGGRAAVVAWPPHGDPDASAVRAAARGGGPLRAGVAGRARRRTTPGARSAGTSSGWTAATASVGRGLGRRSRGAAGRGAGGRARSRRAGSSPSPGRCRTSALLSLAADPEAYARRLVRPMPRPPAAAARRGTAFHAWLESRSGQLRLLDPDDVPGAADADIGEDAELAGLRDAFLARGVGRPGPARGGGAVRARPGRPGGPRPDRRRLPARDRVRGAVGGRRLEDRPPADADPLQLAVYRLAWAERVGVPVEQVDATVAYLRLGGRCAHRAAGEAGARGAAGRGGPPR